VIDVFMEQGIEFDGAAGISAGAVFGCNIKSRQIGRPIRYNKKYCKDPRYCSIRSLLKTGDLYGVEFCYHELVDVLDPFDQETFRENAIDFYVGATDVNTGRAVFHKCSDGGEKDIQWMRRLLRCLSCQGRLRSGNIHFLTAELHVLSLTDSWRKRDMTGMSLS
jgi:predicted patatin/cPLA2 family phospholipase